MPVAEPRSGGHQDGRWLRDRRGSDMWPWEHLAISYLAYSLLGRLAWRRPRPLREPPSVTFGTQFPDLVDKPLG